MKTGTKLQQARIGRGLTLAHISAVTKIPSRVLELIEINGFDRLPAGLLTRAYLRAFATEVGLDPEGVVDGYRAESGRVSPEDEPFRLPGSYHEEKSSAPHAALVLIIGLAILIYFAYPRPVQRRSGMEIVADAAGPAVDAAPTIGTTVAVSALTPQIAPSPVAADSEGLRIELQPQAECWLSAVADGRLVLYRLMQGGERETINARDEVLLRVGDAGALAYFVNGGVGRSLGGPGEAVTVRITSDDSAAWLTPVTGT